MPEPGILILSSAYVNDDIAAEYGKLPPCMLPHGAGRLLDRQLARVGPGRRIVFTLPEDFPIAANDLPEENERLLVLRYDARRSLVDVLLSAIQEGDLQGDFEVLFGDTLFTDQTQLPPDAVAVGADPHPYRWTFARHDGDPCFVRGDGTDDTGGRPICGYFRFSAIEELASTPQDNLEDILNTYSSQRSLGLVSRSDWQDLGHLSTLFKARRQALVSRCFNTIQVTGETVCKRSLDKTKMEAEAVWYENLPAAMALHAPRYLGRVEEGYRTEYLNLPMLSEIFVFGRLPSRSWDPIAEAIGRLLDLARNLSEELPAQHRRDLAAKSYDRLTKAKTIQRVSTFLSARPNSRHLPATFNGSSVPSLEEMVEASLSRVPDPEPRDCGFVHGDLFLSNMFFDSRAERVFCIDPRGVENLDHHAFGDLRYDLGKLGHSLIGYYDHAIFGRSRLIRSGPSWDHCVSISSDTASVGKRILAMLCQAHQCPLDVIRAQAALMFFSMLPLHADDPDRQDLLLAHGIRLFLENERSDP